MRTAGPFQRVGIRVQAAVCGFFTEMMQHGAKDKKRPRPVGLDGTIGGAVVKESFKRKKLELDSLTKLQGVEEEKSWKKKKMMMMKKEKNKEKHRLGASNQSFMACRLFAS